MAENKLTRKYGLFTALCMLVGTIIGSGIFFRNEEVLAAVGGNLAEGAGAWLLGGLITLSGAYMYAILAVKYENATGLLDYSEQLIGKKFAYFHSWFLSMVFYPNVVGILSWVSARFTIVLFGWDADPGFSAYTYLLALFYLIVISSINAFSPKLSGVFQVSTTIIKIIPLVAMGLIGGIAGLFNGITASNLHSTYTHHAVRHPFLAALVATAFAYLGWDTLINLNGEIKNPKRNLPLALVGGMLCVIGIYILYFLGIFSALPVEDLVGGAGVRGAFVAIFSPLAGTALFVFIVISCLGTLNGLIVGGQRMIYSLAAQGQGIAPKLFKQVDPQTNVPYNASTLLLLLTACWMVAYGGNFAGWYGGLFFDLPGLIPVAFNIFLIPIFVSIMKNQKDLGVFNRFIAPVLAISGALFLIYGVFYNEGTTLFIFLLFLAVFMGTGAYFYKME